MAIVKDNPRVGQLKNIIQVQKMTSSTDSMGFLQEHWETVATERARVEFDDRQIREIFRSEGISSTIGRTFMFRYPKHYTITVKDRIVFKDETYEIYGHCDINDNGRYIKVWGRNICL